MRLATALFVLLSTLTIPLSDPVLAQDTVPIGAFDFKVATASVSEGATNVGLTTTVTLSLDGALPDDDMLEAFGIETAEDLLIETGDATVLSSTIGDDRDEVAYELQLSADTDYALVFYGIDYEATSATNVSFRFQPFAVNFTTSATAGTATIEGRLTLDESEFPNADPDFTNALVIIQSQNSSHTYAQIVADASNSYGITFARGGTYILSAFNFGVQLVGGVYVTAPGFGFHDPNEDGFPDLVTVEADGSLTADIEMNAFFFEVPSANEETPDAAGSVLEANAPNPVRASTSITYALSRPQEARLVVYDVLGREVAVLADGLQSAGAHTARFDVSRLPAGLYLYRLETSDRTLSRTMTVVR